MALQVDDYELIRSFQEGNTAAFDHVVAEHRDSLYRHAMRRLNQPAAAEDAVQEVFLRAYRSFGRLRYDSRISSWLHQIMVNVCIDEANRRRRHEEKAQRVIGEPLHTHFEPGPEDQLGLDRADLSPMIDALATLPSAYQEALTMRFVDELSYEQMAAATGTSEDNARARVSRARSAVRQLLRGVALAPIALFALVRRGPKNTEALERVGQVERIEQTQRMYSAAESTAFATKMAVNLAPAAESITAVANASHQAAPLITKAAIGIGAVSMFAMGAGSERTVVPPPPPPPVVEVAAPAVEPVAAPEPVARVATPAPSVTAVEAVASATTLAPAEQPALEPGATSATASAAPATVPGAPGATGTVPGETPANAPGTPGAPSNAPAAPPAPAAPVLTGGQLSVGALSVVANGPRFDVSGPVVLTVGGVEYRGSLSGRLGIAADPNPSATRRLDGTLTLNVDGRRVEIRLQGSAVPLDAEAPGAPVAPPADQQPAETPTAGNGDGTAGDPAANAPAGDGAVDGTGDGAGEAVATSSTPRQPTRFSVSGQFRVTGGDGVKLVASGSFSGGFTPGSLTLTLS